MVNASAVVTGRGGQLVVDPVIPVYLSADVTGRGGMSAWPHGNLLGATVSGASGTLVATLALDHPMTLDGVLSLAGQAHLGVALFPLSGTLAMDGGAQLGSGEIIGLGGVLQFDGSAQPTVGAAFIGLG